MNFDLDTKTGMANAIAWTQSLLDSLTDNGVWMVPRSGTLVHFNKPEKKAVVSSFTPDPSLARVLTAMGYDVTERVA